MRLPPLTPEERDRVTAAVTAAEVDTDAEIVTIIAQRSDSYHDVALHYALAAMLLLMAAAALYPAIVEVPIGWFGNGWTSAATLGSAIFALMVAQAIVFLVVRYALAWPMLRMMLTPGTTQARRVRRRAVQYFRVGAERRTAARIGVLVYLSLDERLAEIVADQAIHAKVVPERWGAAMAALVDHLRAGRAGEGMAAAVTAIGAIVATHFPKTDSDVNELPDRLIEL
ncbi:TPM domain-containing protein [uncultured Sphingomonas sp.]|uniref:TPM domain-containing protein n=1 Tax=uncultured Sphingomonas sp. TaxID=158754 RepID=UPI0035CAE8B7